MRSQISFPLVFASCLASSCAKSLPPGQYRLPVGEVYARLLSNPFKDFRDNRQCGILIHIAADGDPNRSIVWHVASSNREMLYFTASLTALEDNLTKVDIEVGPKEWNGREAYDGTMAYKRPAVGQPVRPAIQEQIASILENRTFNAKNAPHNLDDRICNVQRAGLEMSLGPLSVNDSDVKTIRAVDPKSGGQ